MKYSLTTFSIRDLLWVTVVAALLLGLVLEWRANRPLREEVKKTSRTMGYISNFLRSQRIEVEIKEDGGIEVRGDGIKKPRPNPSPQQIGVPAVDVLFFEEIVPRIAIHGKLTKDNHRKHFLDHYAIEGERIRAPASSVVVGLLFARDHTTIVSVPIRSWSDGSSLHFLCQASDDGNPPEFSAFAPTQNELLAQIKERLSLTTIEVGK